MSDAILMWEHHAWDSPIRVGGRAFAERFLDRGWHVAWLNGPLAFWNLRGGNDEIRRRRRVWISGGVRESRGRGRLFRYAPLSAVAYRPYPVLDRPWFHRHGLDLTFPSLFPLLEEEGFGQVNLLWLATGSPFLPLLKRLPHRRSLYRLSDDTSAFPETPRSYAALEAEAMGTVDLVVATAHSLVERARRFSRQVLFLPNGVDLARFAAAREQAGRRRPGRRPRVIYVGALDSWFDDDRVAALARALPEVDFRLAGPSRRAGIGADGPGNLRWLGPIRPEDVPDLLAGSDAGIIPFRDSPLTRAIHPVKLYEYFAAGLPVVAQDLEEIRRIGSPALLARTDDEWIDALRQALAGGDGGEGLAFASGHDWSRRFDALLEALGETAASGRAAPGGGR